MRKTLIILITLSFASSVFAQSVIITDGETSPNTLLEINDEGTTGSITFPSGGTPDPITNKLYNEGGTLKWNGSALNTGIGSLWSQNGGKIYYNTGNVGIGNSSPTVILDIKSSGVDVPARLRLANSDKSHNLFLYSGDSGNQPYISFLENDALLFTMYDGAISNELVRINSDGNVGIGTTNPIVKLEVADIIRVGGHTWPGVGKGMELAYNPDQHRGYIQVFDRDGSSWGSLFLGNGNVGIGTLNPSASLHVSGTTKIGINVDVISITDIIEITGTTASSGRSTDIVYPTGWNANNTRVLSCDIRISSTEWVGNGGYDTITSFLTILEDKIYIRHTVDPQYHNAPFRLVLMKVS